LPAISLGQSKPQRRSPVAPAAAAPQQIASGRYVLVSDSKSAKQRLNDPWTLSREAGRLLLEEKWIVSSGDEEGTPVDFHVEMTSGMHPTAASIGSGEGKMSCSMALNLFSCTRRDSAGRLDVRSPYYFFLPSPWMVAAAVRDASKSPDKITTVRLVMLGKMNPGVPELRKIEAQVQYLGADEVEVSGRKVTTSIYEVRPAGAPAVTIWLMANGIPAMMQDSEKPEQRIELLDYVQVRHGER